MRAVLIDLTLHCIWSDDTPLGCNRGHSRRVRGCSFVGALPSRSSRAIRVRLSDSQRRDRRTRWRRRLDPGQLREWGCGRTLALFSLARQLSDDDLSSLMDVPWFKEPPIELSRGDAIVQACLHSIHHRGRIATEFCRLGGHPSTMDFIIWVWNGRPGPDETPS